MDVVVARAVVEVRVARVQGGEGPFDAFAAARFGTGQGERGFAAGGKGEGARKGGGGGKAPPAGGRERGMGRLRKSRREQD